MTGTRMVGFRRSVVLQIWASVLLCFSPLTNNTDMQAIHTVGHAVVMRTNRWIHPMCKCLCWSGQCLCRGYFSTICTSKRVFILGPSHHVYMSGCALSSTTHYQTPLYDLEIDQSSKTVWISSLSQVRPFTRLIWQGC